MSKLKAMAMNHGSRYCGMYLVYSMKRQSREKGIISDSDQVAPEQLLADEVDSSHPQRILLGYLWRMRAGNLFVRMMRAWSEIRSLRRELLPSGL